MSIEEIDKALDTTRPCLIVYAMGSTFKGAIDDMNALNDVIDISAKEVSFIPRIAYKAM